MINRLRLVCGYLISIFLIISCASADLKIPRDSNPSPLDTNYLTLAFRVNCDGEKLPTDFGHAQCAMPYESSLANSSVTIMSPFNAALTISSYEAKFNERYILKAGQFRTFTLDQLVPIQTEYATYSFFVMWEKPEEIKTEVPVRGQRGQFHFRLIPEGKKPATLTWSPDPYEVPFKGISSAQFQALAEPKDPVTAEPLRLNIQTSVSVADGRFQLYNSSKGIGVKNTPFAGDEILIPADALTGPGKVDNYTLFGYARTEFDSSKPTSLLKLDDDFIVAVSQYRYDTAKLAVEVDFTETEVCYTTESAIFLAAFTSLESEFDNVAVNAKPEHCFPRPGGKAEMFFMTNVGRSAVVWLDGATARWRVLN